MNDAENVLEEVETQVETDTDTGETTDEATDWEAKFKELNTKYEDLKANSRKWEKRANADKKAAESTKSDNESLQSQLNELQSKVEKYEADAARRKVIDAVVSETGVNRELLSRMVGDDEESIKANAELLAGIKPQNSYKKPGVVDAGEPGNSPAKLTKEEIKAIKDNKLRRKAIGENLDLFQKET